MARHAKAGWYPDDHGGRRYWDGRAWTGRFDPAPLTPTTPPGWFPDSAETTRWWDGTKWADARLANDGHFDVRLNIGQGILTASAMGTADQGVIVKFHELLATLPPAQVVQMQTEFSTFGMPATTIVAVVEWARPR